MKADERLDRIAQIHARAWHDDAFRARLKSDPHAVLTEAGLDAPKGLKIHVHEESDHEAHWVIPARPRGVSDEDVDAGKVKPDICSIVHPDICSMT